VSAEPPAQLLRAAECLRSAGLDAGLFATPPNVTYVSGFEAPMPMGYVTEVTGWLPALALVRASDAAGWLVVPDLLLPMATTQTWFDRILSFETLGHFAPADPEATFAGALRVALREAGLGSGPIVLGVEPVLPLVAERVVREAHPAADLRDAMPAITQARTVKTAREVELLRAAAALADVAQETFVAAAATHVGRTDVDLWSDLVTAMEHRAGKPLTVVGALMTGVQTADLWAGGPIGRTIEQGDAGLLDISPRLDGYWADCANPMVFGGTATAEHLRYVDAAKAAFDAALEALRPGRRCCDVHKVASATLERHGFPVEHYTGHQIGVSPNDPPRLVPYDETVLQAGMVLAIEPGVYAGGAAPYGARAERMVLLTDAGPEILTTFSWGL
jgi:Xaa-Pro aminopeptidase